MSNEPYWFDHDVEPLPAIDRNITTEALVIGGGVAGLTVAQLLSEQGREVVVVERGRCGGGATGRSSGFITPDSELQVEQLSRRFGDADAGFLWRAAASSCDHVRETIVREEIECDDLQADSLYAGAGSSGRSTVESEHEARTRAGLPSSLYQTGKLRAVIGAEGFASAVRYSGTFAMTPHRYALGLRDRLRSRGVRIHERSAVESIDGASAVVNGVTVRARQVFICADSDLSRFDRVGRGAYHAQTFLASTEPLEGDEFAELFPDGDLLVWDTDLVYQYFRRTADNRLLLGGGQLRKTYAPPADPRSVLPHLQDYAHKRLPMMRGAEFTSVWSGLIGVTKDLLPLAGPDARHSGRFYAGCAAGIPWSVLAARCAVETALEGHSDLLRFFDPQRAFTDLDPLQPVARKPLTFALSHAYTKGALRGSAQAVKRRRPLIAVSIFAAAALLVRTLAKAMRR